MEEWGSALGRTLEEVLVPRGWVDDTVFGHICVLLSPVMQSMYEG